MDSEYRNERIVNDWAFVSTSKFTTRITTPYSDRHVPVRLRTDMYIRTDLSTTGFMNQVESLKNKEYEIDESDDQIRAILENSLVDLVKGEEETVFSLKYMTNKMLNKDYDELMAKRVHE